MSQQRIDFRNEFANIRLSTEVGRCGTRLKVTDLETSATTYLDPLELATLCEWPEEERRLVVAGQMYGLLPPWAPSPETEASR